jgi:hypothetical protein
MHGMLYILNSVQQHGCERAHAHTHIQHHHDHYVLSKPRVPRLSLLSKTRRHTHTVSLLHYYNYMPAQLHGSHAPLITTTLIAAALLLLLPTLTATMLLRHVNYGMLLRHDAVGHPLEVVVLPCAVRVIALTNEG